MNNRLKTALSYIKGHRFLADIGTDHAYLPIEAVRSGAVRQAIASDLRDKPLKRAKSNVEEAGLSTKIQIVKGNGLEVLVPGVDVVSILGMGGITIREMLSQDDLKHVDRLILSPNSKPEVVRTWLENHHFEIIDESFVRERAHDYVIIVARTGSMHLSKIEKEFGPCVIRKKQTGFVRMVERKIATLESARQKARSESERLRIMSRIETMKELIE